jgi:hypothetical protein
MRRGNHEQAKLPTKVCPVCDRAFRWRKKWERDWEQVRYCSKACGREAKRGKEST